MLNRTSRAALVIAALLAFAAAFVLTLGQGRGAPEPHAAASSPAPTRLRTSSAPVFPLRDPFAAPPDAPSDGPARPNATLPKTPLAPAPPTPILHVLAVVTGPQPAAVADDGTGPRLVAPGDRLGNRRIAAIDDRGLTFDDGTRLSIDADTGRP
jgi:hypothetical protein